MRAFVFTDSSLTRHAGQFVWLAINIENSVNAPFLLKFPVGGLPTLMIIDPKSETMTLRYQGSATVLELEKLLSDGSRIVRGKPDEAIMRADRLASKQPAEAAKA